MRIDKESSFTLVLASTAAAGTRQGHLPTLWDKLKKLAWLPKDGAQVVIQIGQRDRSRPIIETAHSLALYLNNTVPRTEIQIIDPAARADEWQPFPLLDDTAGFLTISAVASLGELRVPRLWLRSYFLITVAGAGPSRRALISGMMDAQAEPLSRLANGFWPPQTLTSEAHRLAASDLCILCGNKTRTKPDSPFWWLISRSDLAVEQALAAAAGAASRKMPNIREIGRHETSTLRPALRGTAGTLQGYVAPSFSVYWYGLWSRGRGFLRLALRDFHAAKGNLRKIPSFIRRRCAKIRAEREGA